MACKSKGAPEEMVEIEIEVTDLFAGEANYCWLNRYKIQTRKNESRRARIRRVKREIGWTGVRCEIADYGDQIEIRPRGLLQIAFVMLNW